MSKGSGRKIEAAPTISRRTCIVPPKVFPMAMLALPFVAASTAIPCSGRAPAAPMIKAITIIRCVSIIPIPVQGTNSKASSTAPVNKCPAKKMPANPKIVKNMEFRLL